MKKRILIISTLILIFAGCVQQENNGKIKSGNIVYDRTCIDGVEYLQTSSGHSGYMAPHSKKGGALYLCD